MTIKKEVTVEGEARTVTISDEREALLAAKAAGGAIIGIWSPHRENEGEADPEWDSVLSQCLYLVCGPEAVTGELLERVVRRHLGLPWVMGETKRLLIREFAAEDPLEEPSKLDGDGVFSSWEKREAYRKSQYVLCECGLWALVEKESGRIVGKAGITGGELGYHIYEPYRQRGYGLEACQGIMKLAREEMDLDGLKLFLEEDNEASRALAEKLGFAERKKEDREGEEEKISGKVKEYYCHLRP